MKVQIINEALRIPKARSLNRLMIKEGSQVYVFSDKLVRGGSGTLEKDITIGTMMEDDFYPQVMGRTALIRGKKSCIVNVSYASEYKMREFPVDSGGDGNVYPVPYNFTLFESDVISSVSEANALFDGINKEIFGSLAIDFDSTEKTMKSVMSKFPSIARRFNLQKVSGSDYWKEYEGL